MSETHTLVIVPHPEVPAAVVAGGLSGHGFAFGPALGAMLADLALDGESGPWSPCFAPHRFDAGTEPSRDRS